MSIVSVDFETCKTALVDGGGLSAREEYGLWRGRGDLVPVHRFVMEFTHKYIYDVSQADVLAVAGRTSHALGKVRREENIEGVRDFSTPFAFQYLFHYYLESKSAIPTWLEMRNWMVYEVADRYVRPFEDRFGLDVDDQLRTERDRAHWRALRWRVGNMYYSALRELHLMTTLREVHGVDLAYHILADVVLRCDFWKGRTLVALYIGNDDYRDHEHGRKRHIRKVFGDASGFEIVEGRLTPAEKFGEVKLVPEQAIGELAERIRMAGTRHPGSVTACQGDPKHPLGAQGEAPGGRGR